MGFQVLAGSIGGLGPAEVEALHGGVPAEEGCARVKNLRPILIAESRDAMFSAQVVCRIIEIGCAKRD